MTFEKPILACSACASAFLLLGMTVAPAFAAEPVVVTAQRPTDEITRIVKFGDLNIATAQGEKTLLRRVSGAVHQVCDDPGFDYYQEDRACRKFAWSGTRPQIASALQRAKLNNGLASAAMTISIAAR